MQKPDSTNSSQVARYSGLIILGFGGHARSVTDVALAAGITDFCFVDENTQPGETFLGFPVIAQWRDELTEGWSVFPAAGDNARRKEQMDTIQNSGWPIATLIAPTATIGAGSAINQGSFIGHHAHIGPMAKVGAGCIVNTSAVIEHECIVGEFTHISVNSTIAGRSKIGNFVMVGAGAIVIDGVNIADGVIIGAGAVVKKSILEMGVYVGVPVKRVNP